MRDTVTTAYGTVVMKDEWLPERVQEILARFAYETKYRKEEEGNAA